MYMHDQSLQKTLIAFIELAYLRIPDQSTTPNYSKLILFNLKLCHSSEIHTDLLVIFHLYRGHTLLEVAFFLSIWNISCPNKMQSDVRTTWRLSA